MWRRAGAAGLAVAVGLVLAAGDGRADDKANPAVVPVPRDSLGWAPRHESLVKRAKAGNVDVLFLGDSITQGWDGYGKAEWAKHFDPLRAANFGISGDRTEHVLWRITEGKELEGIDPKVVVLMIGTNNAGSNSAEQIAAGVAAIVKTLREKEPQAKVLLLGVFPRSGKSGKDLKGVAVVPADGLHPKIGQINERIAKLADGANVVYLDIGPKFLDKDGGLAREVMYDYLHLTPKGYALWAEAIKAKVEALLKG